jgi:hypothetical protein
MNTIDLLPQDSELQRICNSYLRIINFCRIPNALLMTSATLSGLTEPELPLKTTQIVHRPSLSFVFKIIFKSLNNYWL